jgi:hypothetical protein
VHTAALKNDLADGQYLCSWTLEAAGTCLAGRF